MSEKPANPDLITMPNGEDLSLGDLYLMAVVANRRRQEQYDDWATECFDRVEALLTERERRGW